MSQSYEVTVERKIRNTFNVEARSRTDAAAKVGMLLAGDDPFGDTTETVVDMRMTTPQLVDVAEEQAV